MKFGYYIPSHEYAVFGREWKTAQPRLAEALEVITRAWSDVPQSQNHRRHHRAGAIGSPIA